jgi:hypothetical protein
MFWHEEHTESRKEELGDRTTMNREFWSVFGEED